MVPAVIPLALADDLPLIPLQEPMARLSPLQEWLVLARKMRRCLGHLAVQACMLRQFRFVRPCTLPCFHHPPPLPA